MMQIMLHRPIESAAHFRHECGVRRNCWRKGKRPMRSDYSKLDLGAGVRGKYLKDYYAVAEGERKADALAKPKKASPPRGRKRR
jgi:hypothetical protein